MVTIDDRDHFSASPNRFIPSIQSIGLPNIPNVIKYSRQADRSSQ